MILTCPACGTQYVVKDGAIPPAGRQVRCAACKHSWHQDPGPASDEPEAAREADVPAPEPAATPPEPDYSAADEVPEATTAEPADEWSPAEAGEEPPLERDEPEEFVAPTVAFASTDETVVSREVEAVDAPPVDVDEAVGEPAPGPVRAERAMAADTAYDEDFSPFAARYEEEPKRGSRLMPLLLLLLLIAATAAAFWFLAPPAWKERLGVAAVGATPLQLMMTHSDRQKLASGNELLAVSGRVINPTDESQNVPPIRAQLRSATGELVYSWTIAPPARVLPPGASATFNSAEVNVPAGGDELTITLGSLET